MISFGTANNAEDGLELAITEDGTLTIGTAGLRGMIDTKVATAVQEATKDTVKGITADNGTTEAPKNSAIEVTEVTADNGEGTQVPTGEVKLGLKLDNTGNVQFEETEAGLKANVDLTDVQAKVDENDKVLSLVDGALKTELALTYGAGTADTEFAGKSTIKLTGKGGNVISEFDAAEFIKDGMLKSVALVTEKPVEGGDPVQGDFIKFVFTTDEGERPEYVEFRKLPNVNDPPLESKPKKGRKK